MAVEITRNPKWYHRDTDITLVRDNSSNKVAREIINMPANNDEGFFIWLG
jgi:hypothetical protein